MSSAVYFDAYLLASPAPSPDLQAIKQYIHDVIQWHELRRNNWLQQFICQHAAHTLFVTEGYPSFDILKAAIALIPGSYVQAKDVIEIVSSILEKSTKVENDTKIEDF